METILQEAPRHSLQVLLHELRYGRPAADQKWLEEKIQELAHPDSPAKRMREKCLQIARESKGDIANPYWNGACDQIILKILNLAVED